MISDIVRNLAKSEKHQSLFSMSKDINGVRLFKNEMDFGYLQVLYLNWLNIYHSLYTDLIREEEFIDEEILKDIIRVDAYLVYRNKVKNKKQDKLEQDNKKQRIQAPGIPKIIFTPKRK